MDELELFKDFLNKKKNFDEIQSLMSTQQASRDPASVKSDPWAKLQAIPDKPQSVPATELPQKQSPMVIESSPMVEAKPTVIQSISGVPKSDVPKFTFGNYNNVLDDMVDARDAKGNDLKDATAQSDVARSDYKNTISSLKDAFKEYPGDPELDNRIKNLEDKRSNIGIPDRDMWAQAIMSLGPALLGGLTGSAGMKAALPAQKEAQAMYEVTRKEELANAKLTQGQVDSKIKSLQNLKKQNEQEFYRNQSNVKSVYGLMLQAQSNLVNATGKDKIAAQKNVDDLNQLIPKTESHAIDKIGDQEQTEEKINIQKNKAARSGSGGLKDKDWMNLSKQLDPNQAPSRSVFGSAGKILYSADRVDVLKKQFPNYAVPKAQMHEIANAAAGMINGGGTAQSQQQINAIVPSSVGGEVADIESWLTNRATPRQQQDFVKTIFDSVAREKEAALEKIKQTQSQILSGAQTYYQADPNRYLRLLQPQGIKKEDLGKYGEIVRKQAPAAAASAPTSKSNSGVGKEDKLKRLEDMHNNKVIDNEQYLRLKKQIGG